MADFGWMDEFSMYADYPEPSDKAKAFHSITFIGESSWKNTWDDWHLVPSSRPLVEPPEVKTVFKENEGGDGSLDLTTSLTAKPRYRFRSGNWEFIVINNGQLEDNYSYGKWATRYSDLMNYLHGKKLYAILNDDMNYFYEGRYAVASWRSEKDNSKITINYTLYPYKRLISDPSVKRL